MEEMIYHVNNLIFSYNKKIILDIPQLTFEKGKIYTLIGSNGSGKTTLMKIMNGLLKVKIGNILYKNINIKNNNYQTIRNESVYIHQNPYLFSGTVYDNISFGLRLKKIDKKIIDDRVNESLKLVGLENFENRKNKELSIGEIQKIAIARGVILNTEVLLLDEPTANIDSKSVGKIENLLFTLKSKNKTIIFSSHNSFFSYKLCDKIIDIENI